MQGVKVAMSRCTSCSSELGRQRQTDATELMGALLCVVQTKAARLVKERVESAADGTPLAIFMTTGCPPLDLAMTAEDSHHHKVEACECPYRRWQQLQQRAGAERRALDVCHCRSKSAGQDHFCCI